MLIAEIGLNHKGSEERALKMLEDLVATDIDAITFQIQDSLFYEKNKEWGGALSNNFYKDTIDFVHKKNKLIGFAIKDKSTIAFFNSAGADFWKSLSISISDDNLLNELQKTNKPIFVSTGISDDSEIIKAGKKLKNIKFVHTQLSHGAEDANLKAIAHLRALTNKEIAFGLHCSDLNVLNLSVAYEPSDILFYVKDNSQEKFPDDEHAIIIENVDNIIKELKKLEKSLGNGIKEKMEIKL
jgi:sialic acid synthase SpsE